MDFLNLATTTRGDTTKRKAAALESELSRSTLCSTRSLINVGRQKGWPCVNLTRRRDAWQIIQPPVYLSPTFASRSFVVLAVVLVYRASRLCRHLNNIGRVFLL
jgi:hypothetical protein